LQDAEAMERVNKKKDGVHQFSMDLRSIGITPAEANTVLEELNSAPIQSTN
jgi:hypothetical protein